MATAACTGEGLQQLLASLTGRKITIRAADAQALDPTRPAAVAVFAYDGGALAATCWCDLPLAAFLGAAPTSIPPGTARESIAAGVLAGHIADGFHEVMNIVGGMVGDACGAHVALTHVHVLPTALPAELGACLASGRHRGRFAVEIGGYGGGGWALLAAAGAPAQTTTAAATSTDRRAPPTAAITASIPTTATNASRTADAALIRTAPAAPAAAAPAAAAAGDRPLLLPTLEPIALAKHLSALLGSAVAVDAAPPLAAQDLTWAAIAAFVCDDGTPAVVCLCDLALTCASACALAGLDAAAAAAAMAAGGVAADLLDAFREVMNVIGGFLNDAGRNHLLLRIVHAGSSPLPRNLPAAIARSPRRYDFAVRIPGHRPGRLLAFGQ